MPTQHIRRTLREAVATAVTGLATTSTRVYQSRMRPATDTVLPCLLVTVDGSELEEGLQNVQQRNFAVVVRGLAKAGATLDDTLDQIALEVETAVESAGTFTGLVPGGLTLERDEIDFDDTLEKPVGVIGLYYRAVCFTHAGAPGAVI